MKSCITIQESIRSIFQKQTRLNIFLSSVYIYSLFICHTGAHFPGLDWPGLVTVWEDLKLVVWGGMVVWSRWDDTLQGNQHLYELKYSKQRGKTHFDVTKYAVPGTLSQSRKNYPATEQSGTIPDGKNYCYLNCA